jgi:hypothetical protein
LFQIKLFHLTFCYEASFLARLPLVKLVKLRRRHCQARVGRKSAGVVVGDKRRKVSSHDDEQEEADEGEEDGIDKRGGKAGKGLRGKCRPHGEGGRGGGKRKKDLREEDEEEQVFK